MPPRGAVLQQLRHRPLRGHLPRGEGAVVLAVLGRVPPYVGRPVPGPELRRPVRVRSGRFPDRDDQPPADQVVEERPVLGPAGRCDPQVTTERGGSPAVPARRTARRICHWRTGSGTSTGGTPGGGVGMTRACD